MRLGVLAVLALAAPVITGEQQASIHIKVTSDKQLRGNIKGGEQTCHVMDWYDWSDFIYACQWDHGSLNGYNLYFMRYNGKIVWECGCDNHLGSYDPWDLNVWTWTGYDGVACYTRDGKTYDQVTQYFDNVSCDQRHLKNCDQNNDQCVFFDHGGGDYLLDDTNGGHRCKRPPCAS